MNGKAYKKAELLDAGPYPVLRVGNFFTNNHWYYSDLELDEDKYCDDGDLLYAWSASFGPRIWNGGKVIYHYHIWKVLPVTTKLNSNFLYYFFDWDKEAIKREQGAGATMIHVSKGSMEARSIPLPPLEEQRRIVAVLDEAFEGLDRARANTEANLQNARELFALSFEHELLKYEGVSEMTTVGDICSGFEYGTSAKSKPQGQMPVLRMGNLQSGEIDWNKLVYTDVDSDIQKLELKDGDVLFNRTNSLEHVGKSAIYRGERPAIFAGYLIRIHFDRKKLIPYFLNLFLNSSGARSYGRTISGKSVNQANISGSKLKTYPIMVPPVKVQEAIIEKANSIRQPLVKVADSYVNKLKDLENLRQSILQKAFSGELTASKQYAPSVPANDNESHSEFIIVLAYGRHQTAGKEATFGHVKAQKILSLTESLCDIDLGREPTRQRAGPNDMPHMNRMEGRAAKQQAFKFRERPGGYTFETLSAFDSTVREAQHKLTPIMPALNKLIELVVNMDTQETEVLATVHAAWNNLIIDNAEIDNEAIVRAAREDWHPDKMNIPRPLFFEAIATIKSNGIKPDGTAKYVPAMQESLF